MFAVLHLADFPLHAILRTAPDLAAKPVAILASPRARASLLALTAAARAAGVTLGLTAPQALARCAALTLRLPDPAAESEASAALLAAARLLSPTVETTAPGVVTADLRALPADRHDPLLTAALTQLAALALPATAALAPTPLLALYAARQLPIPPFRPSALLPFPARLRRVTDPRAFLAPLPLATAEPPPHLVPILAGWGITTLGQLTALPKADIAQRLGPAGLALWERAAGETTRPLTPAPLPVAFAARLELEEPIETLEPLLFLLRRYLDRLALELRTAGLAAATLTLTLPLEDETEHTRTFRLPEPTASADLLYRTLDAYLGTLRTTTAVTGLRLHLEPTRPLARQPGLFDAALRDPHAFASTLAATAALLGPDRVGTPQLLNTHGPDAFTLTSPAALVPPAPAEILPPLGLPLRRFRPPRPATIELTNHAPGYVWTPDCEGAVSDHRGPWHTNGEWWTHADAWTREEWDVALADGGLYRLFRTPAGWWLEGEYD